MLKRFFPVLVAACGFAADVTTFHNDNARTGQNLSETTLTPANVNSTTFGKLFVINVDGKVDAQPLYLTAVNFGAQGTHNALYVATEHGTVYAFDADNGTLLWSKTTLGAGEIPSEAVNGCSQVSPEIGVTSTPVISQSNGPAEIVPATKHQQASGPEAHRPSNAAGVYHARRSACRATSASAWMNFGESFSVCGRSRRMPRSVAY